MRKWNIKIFLVDRKDFRSILDISKETNNYMLIIHKI